ncbi:MAG TPA: hypothetical protein VGP76_32475 [Planctomycetaceae bacterium]|jgi:hypothetical protein|nr:hypothetical protein [Planctomycetaceae bacterium]
MLYVAQSKIYGKRASIGRQYLPNQLLRDKIAALYWQGIPAGQIFERLRGENHRSENTGKPLTVKTVWKVVKEIDRANPGKRVPESVRRFVEEACRLSPESTILTSQVWRAFKEYCRAAKLPPVSRNKLPAFLRAAVPSVQTRIAHHRGTGYGGNRAGHQPLNLPRHLPPVILGRGFLLACFT